MVDPNTRQGKRTPVTLKIKFKSETLEQFIERYAVDVSQGGIFIRTKEPLAVGTQMKFEFQLRDASPLIGGEGTVVWTRENDPSRPAIAPGMGVRFDRLGEGSQSVLERILAEKAKQSPSRPSEITKPPMFTDTPTRVAPAPVQDALLGRNSSPSGRSRPDSFSESSNTPLPRPMPFHSDADDFDERAFEEATKVRSLDELAAQSAQLGNDRTGTTTNALPAAPPDELLDRAGDGAAADRASTKRADSTIADPPSRDDRDSPFGVDSSSPIHEPEPSRPGGPMIDRDSAPGLPSPPVAITRDVAPAALAASGMVAAKTQLGLEPARVETKQRDAVAPPLAVPTAKESRPAALQSARPPKARAASPAASSSDHLPAARRPSSAPIIIGILVALAAIGGAVWYFVLRAPAEEVAAKPAPGSDGTLAPPPVTDHGSDTASGSGSGSAAVVDNGSSGSGSAVVADHGSAGSAGSAGSGNVVVPPAAVMVDTVIASSVEKAVVEVVGANQTGPAPFTAKLEKGKAYKVTVTAPRYLAKTLDVKGGDGKVVAKLDAKPTTIHVESDPPGAQIYIDNASTTVKTPGDVTLTAAQAARKSVRVGVRMAGKKPFEQLLDTSALSDAGEKVTGSVDAGKLAIQPVVQHQNPPPDRTGSGSATTTNNGSDANGSGATPDKVPPIPTPTPMPPAGGSAGEPEPDWTKKN